MSNEDFLNEIPIICAGLGKRLNIFGRYKTIENSS